MIDSFLNQLTLSKKHDDGGSSNRTNLEPLTRAMTRRIEKGMIIQKTLLMCLIKIF